MDQSNQSNQSISFIQIFMIMMLFNGLASHVIVNPLLLDASGRDAWISVLLTGAVYIPWCALLAFIMKRSRGQHIAQWLQQRTNRFIVWLFLAPLCLQLYLIGGLTIIHTTIWGISNYLPATPQYVLIISLILVCHYAAKSGIRTIAIGAGILLPTVVILGYFVATANQSEKEWSLLRPILEHGWQPALSGSLYAGGAFVEIMLLMLVQHRLKNAVKAWQLMLLGLVLVYITLGPICGAITEFGPQEAAKQMVSPYEQWRLVKLGNYIEHVDFLSVYQWLAGATVRISLSQFLITELLPLRTAKMRNRAILFITVSYLVLAIIVSEENTFYLHMFRIYFPATLIMTLVFTSVWAVFALFAKSAKERAA